MKTNKTLAVVTDFNNSVKFEIVAHNFLNSHKSNGSYQRKITAIKISLKMQNK